MTNKEKQVLIREGRNQVLYLLLNLADENVSHDNWHPEMANALAEARFKIVERLKHEQHWPRKWPDFEKYTYTVS